MRSRVVWHALGATSLMAALAACSENASVPTQLRSASATSRSAATGGKDAPVTSTITDDDQSIGTSLQIRSDGGGPYKNSSSANSTISSAGKWLLDTYFARSSTRTIYLDFSRPVPGSGPNGGDAVAIPSGKYKFQAFVDCPSPYYKNSFLTIAPGQTVHCPLHVGELYVGTQLYSVNMNPNPGAEGFAWTETNYANVTCISATAPCSHWIIAPSANMPDGSLANVTVLLKHVATSTKGQTTTTPVKQGDFYMSFKIDVTMP